MNLERSRPPRRKAPPAAARGLLSIPSRPPAASARALARPLSSSRGSTLLAAIAAVAIAALAPTARAQVEDPSARTIAAIELAHAGRGQEAIAELAELAEARPDSVPIHRALAVVALAEGQADAWRSAFRQRLRRTARDVGAGVGLAILENARDRRSESHRLLLSAMTAGARHPLLVPLLIETTNDRAGLLGFMGRRRAVIPRDAAFAALYVRTALAIGRFDQARDVLEIGLEREPDHPDLLALRAAMLHAAGEERAACEAATLALGFLAGESSVPELRVPRRLALARALGSCSRLDEAATALGGLGSLTLLSGRDDLAERARAVSAELLLERGRPLDAFAATEELAARLDELGAAERELVLTVRARARARLGLPLGEAERATLLESPLPGSLLLSDRALALAAAAATPDAPLEALRPRLVEASRALADKGLPRPAARLAVVAESLGAEIAPPEELADDPEVRVARALVAARRALVAEDPAGALGSARVLRELTSPLPGALSAALRLAGARGALETRDAAAARELAEDGLLDVLEQNRSGLVPEPELAALELDAALLGAALAGARAEAARLEGLEAAPILEGLLEDLGRVTRSWSLTFVPWPRRADDLKRLVPAESCLVIVTPERAELGARGIGVALGTGGAPLFGAPAELLEAPACADASTLLWAGPAAPPAPGLALGPEDPRLLVRLVAPAHLPRLSAGPGALPVETPVGGGPPRPLATLVRALAGAAERLEDAEAGEDDAPLLPEGADETPARVYLGAGLAPAGSPESSGWLVPPESTPESSFLGPEMIMEWPPAPGGGLAALGVAARPKRPAIDKGLWVLADAALAAGRDWVLLSREPLAPQNARALADELAGWERNPLAEARALARGRPELAERLTLWSALGRVEEGASLVPLRLGLLVVALIALAVAAIVIVRRRRGRAS